MSNHFRMECEHGTLAGQCRCPAPDKTVRIVPCPTTCKFYAVLPAVVVVPDEYVQNVEFEPNAYSNAGVLVVPKSMERETGWPESERPYVVLWFNDDEESLSFGKHMISQHGFTPGVDILHVSGVD